MYNRCTHHYQARCREYLPGIYVWLYNSASKLNTYGSFNPCSILNFLPERSYWTMSIRASMTSCNVLAYACNNRMKPLALTEYSTLVAIEHDHLCVWVHRFHSRMSSPAGRQSRDWYSVLTFLSCLRRTPASYLCLERKSLEPGPGDSKLAPSSDSSSWQR